MRSAQPRKAARTTAESRPRTRAAKQKRPRPLAEKRAAGFDGSDPARAKRSKSLAAQAYELIKQDIITGVLRPAEYINESHLCARLGIGRTPVHEAIGQLHQERFVDVIPRKGIIVRPISLDEYLHLDEARLILEVGAMRLAAQRITPAELDRLESIIERGNAARHRGDIEQLLLFDKEFHFALANSIQNPILTPMLIAAYERSLRVWFMSRTNLNIEAARDEHEKLIAALRKRDGETAAQIMRDHILSSRKYTMRAG